MQILRSATLFRFFSSISKPISKGFSLYPAAMNTNLAKDVPLSQSSTTTPSITCGFQRSTKFPDNITTNSNKDGSVDDATIKRKLQDIDLPELNQAERMFPVCSSSHHALLKLRSLIELYKSVHYADIEIYDRIHASIDEFINTKYNTESMKRRQLMSLGASGTDGKDDSQNPLFLPTEEKEVLVLNSSPQPSQNEALINNKDRATTTDTDLLQQKSPSKNTSFNLIPIPALLKSEGDQEVENDADLSIITQTSLNTKQIAKNEVENDFKKLKSPEKPLKNKAFSKGPTRDFHTLHMATQNQINDSNNKVAPRVKKPIILSKEQELVAEIARRGHNLFYTGPAGTGKSLLLKKVIENLREQHPDQIIGVTASTGLAAYNIGGQTINSFTGIGLGKTDATRLARNIKWNRKLLDRWDKLKVLIIDEISMIDGRLLDKLDKVARIVRGIDKPFGGVQVIFCGDFYQLPPVSRTNEAIFAFESEFWKNHIHVTILLKKVFRQQTDTQFLDMLKEVRDGEVSEITTKRFSYLKRELVSNDNLVPTKLFSTRREVDYANNQMLNKIKSGSIKYSSEDTGKMSGTEQGKKMLENFLAPEVITLKKGAQVIMIKNIDDTLVNGSLGTVVGFLDSSTYNHFVSLEDDLHLFNDGNFVKNYENLLRDPSDSLNESIFDFLTDAKEKIMKEIDNGKEVSATKNCIEATEAKATVGFVDADTTDPSFYYDMSTSNFSIEADKPKDSRLQCIESKLQILANLRERENPNNLLPVVCFRLSNGNFRTVVIEREVFKIEDENQEPLIQRKQIPLMLAWALSIHKSQGQTLKFVSVDLKNIFSSGQAYVALSRAEHRRGLQVLNFDPKKVKTDLKVKKFYKNLDDAETALERLDFPERFDDDKDDSEADVSAPGPMTQINNLQKYSATPERFSKYLSRKTPKQATPPSASKKRNDIAHLMNGHNARKSTVLADDSKDTVKKETIAGSTGVQFLEDFGDDMDDIANIWDE